MLNKSDEQVKVRMALSPWEYRSAESFDLGDLHDDPPGMGNWAWPSRQLAIK
jgi:hypothetical protein